MGSAGRQLDRYIRRTESAKAHAEATMTIYVVRASLGHRSRQSVTLTSLKAAINLTRHMEATESFMGEKWTVYPVEVFTGVSPNFRI